MRQAFGVLVFAAGLVGCGDQHLIAPTAREGDSIVRGLVISGASSGVAVTLTPGARERLRGFVELTDGSRLEVTSGITWTADRPDVATVDGEGWVEGVSIGTTDIHARYQKTEGSTAVTVTPLATAAGPGTGESSAGSPGGGSSGGDTTPPSSPGGCLPPPLPSNLPAPLPCPLPLPI